MSHHFASRHRPHCYDLIALPSCLGLTCVPPSSRTRCQQSLIKCLVCRSTAKPTPTDGIIPFIAITELYAYQFARCNMAHEIFSSIRVHAVSLRFRLLWTQRSNKWAKFSVTNQCPCLCSDIARQKHHSVPQKLGGEEFSQHIHALKHIHL